MGQFMKKRVEERRESTKHTMQQRCETADEVPGYYEHHSTANKDTDEGESFRKP